MIACRYVMLKKLFFTALFLGGFLSATESFEKLPAGNLTTGQTEYGVLTAGEGHAAIDRGHAFHGTQALHIRGGENRSVTLKLPSPLPQATPCEFRLQRWTQAAPFSFSFSADGKQLMREDKLSAGGYKGHVKVTVPAGATSLTFNCTSPGKGGALVDSFALHTGDMKIEDVKICNPGVYPIMKRAPYNPVVRIDYSVSGSMNPVTPGRITFRVEPGKVGKVTLRAGNEEGTNFTAQEVYGTASPDAQGNVTLTCNRPLNGDSHLWVEVTPSESTKVGATISFDNFAVKAGQKTYTADFGTVRRDVGCLLAVPGEGVGNQTDGPGERMCGHFRIPGLITTKDGTLLGCFDARYKHGGDLCADIDVAVVRSTDGGRTWTRPEVALDGGPGAANGCGDPAIVQDKTGRIWLQALTCHFGGGASLWTSKTGQDPMTTGQWEMTYSDDDGKTWAKEHVNPTKSIKKDEWHCILAGPGCAITMRDGTIVFPAQIWQHDAKPNCASTICYSKDNGKTWVYGTGLPQRTSECQVVELNDGSLMLNCRNENRSGKRVVYVTKDLGKTWTPHETNNNALIEPTCQASLISCGKNKKGLLFSNPKSNSGRRNMTIRHSADSGKTWNEGYEYDSRGCAGYSCLTMINDKTVGVIYEASFPNDKNHTLAIGFLRLPLSRIVRGDKPGKQ